jgi:hypothetical protein
MTRTRLLTRLAAIAVVALAILAAVGCGPSTATPAPTSAGGVTTIAPFETGTPAPSWSQPGS